MFIKDKAREMLQMGDVHLTKIAKVKGNSWKCNADDAWCSMLICRG